MPVAVVRLDLDPSQEREYRLPGSGPDSYGIEHDGGASPTTVPCGTRSP